MGYQNMTRAEYETLRQQLGDKEMSDLVATFKTNVDGQPVTMPLPPAMTTPTPTGAPTMNTPMQLPMPGQQLPVSGLAQAAQTPAAAPMQTGALTAATAQPMDELNSLRARVAAQEASARARAEDRFAKQQEMIQTMYGGPTTSETLFALSRALLAPRQFTGFGSTLGKISGAFGDIDQQRRAAQQKRAEAQMLLQSSSDDRMEGLEKDSLSNQIKLAEIGVRYKDRVKPERASVDTLGNIRHPITKVLIKQPPQPEIYTLQSYLADPTNTDADKQTAIRNFDKAYGYGAHEVFGEQ